MDNKPLLKNSAILSAIALALLIVSVIIVISSGGNAGQEQFEVIVELDSYTSKMSAAAPTLRLVLFVDALFVLAYVSAIGFAAIAFSHRNLPLAWFTGLGILMVMSLDFWENHTLVQSMDLLATGVGITSEQIAYQAMISATKWQASAVTLFAISFLLPSETLIEKLLVWGTRIGLPIAVPLFVVNPMGLRDLSTLLILVSMAGGLLLLALITWNRSKD